MFNHNTSLAHDYDIFKIGLFETWYLLSSPMYISWKWFSFWIRQQWQNDTSSLSTKCLFGHSVFGDIFFGMAFIWFSSVSPFYFPSVILRARAAFWRVVRTHTTFITRPISTKTTARRPTASKLTSAATSIPWSPIPWRAPELSLVFCIWKSIPRPASRPWYTENVWKIF